MNVLEDNKHVFSGHPNVKLFISHGGLLGIQEAVACGVPMLMVPLYADQALNARAMADRGIARIVKLKEADKYHWRDALHDLLRNPMYVMFDFFTYTRTMSTGQLQRRSFMAALPHGYQTSWLDCNSSDRHLNMPLEATKRSIVHTTAPMVTHGHPCICNLT